MQRARPYGSHKEAAAQVGGMSKPLPTRYRPTNWSAYDAALRNRGSLLAGLDWQMTGPAPNEGRPAPPPVLSGGAMLFCLLIRVLFKLPLRQAVGMVSSLLRMTGLASRATDGSTLCRRQRT